MTKLNIGSGVVYQCHRRAYSPSRSKWWWLAIAGLALIGLIATGVKIWMMR